jgi:6-phosphogluconolactonase
MTVTPRGRIQRCADLEQMSEAAAIEFAQRTAAAAAQRGRARVVLSGGSTPRRLYERLAEEPLRTRIDWSALDFFWSDERAVAPEHPQSNFGMAREALLDRLALRPEQVHRMPADTVDLDAAARAYEREIADAFGVATGYDPPAFDLVLLGLGADGHTASLFPFSDALAERRRWVTAHRLAVNGAERLTLTIPILDEARAVVFLVGGADKAEALAAVLEGPPDPTRLPAQLVRPRSGELLWIVDRAAAGRLQSAEPAVSPR